MSTAPHYDPWVPARKPGKPRGTTNMNDRGNSEDRRRRKLRMMNRWRADVDLAPELADLPQLDRIPTWILLGNTVPRGEGVPVCRCYRCGRPLILASLTADRIVPGCQGGRYVDSNIRPACGRCNSIAGGALRGP